MSGGEPAHVTLHSDSGPAASLDLGDDVIRRLVALVVVHDDGGAQGGSLDRTRAAPVTSATVPLRSAIAASLAVSLLRVLAEEAEEIACLPVGHKYSWRTRMRPRGHRASITQTAKGRQAVRGVAGVAVEFFVDPGHVGPGSATGADPLEQPRRDQGRTESAITLGRSAEATASGGGAVRRRTNGARA